jgi:hypothetical protein
MKRHSPPVALRGPQHYWAVMCRLTLGQGAFTLREVFGYTNGVAPRTVKLYIQRCHRMGAISVVDIGTSASGGEVYRYAVLTPDSEAPILRRATFADDRGRRAQQLWTAMRALRHFAITELAVAASTDDLVIDQRRTREYVRALATAGYVVEIGTRARVGLPARWRLMPQANTGPKAPAITKDGLVDRNLSGPVNPNRRLRGSLDDSEPRGRAA